ncbi:hypothetical protein D5018_02795 [Parashewanella curva]|uniref:Uncharacterized protein n=1 Tax=Parashewanella curva TaxID=2338552 RepID=A0A3L8Q0P1_9GAMM|nr:hypothetical protein [Parashewanella curva]RLV61201.1 hypothetical protein D5018_02795 [Parashewanella curva]
MLTRTTSTTSNPLPPPSTNQGKRDGITSANGTDIQAKPAEPATKLRDFFKKPTAKQAEPAKKTADLAATSIAMKPLPHQTVILEVKIWDDERVNFINAIQGFPDYLNRRLFADRLITEEDHDIIAHIDVEVAKGNLPQNIPVALQKSDELWKVCLKSINGEVPHIQIENYNELAFLSVLDSLNIVCSTHESNTDALKMHYY